MLSIGSLFSGIGGLELGLERAGLGPVLWQVEIDPFCRGVLARHWPKAERFSDVKTVGSANLFPVDVICGGFPCQDVSSAGKRAGLVNGSRTGLWREYARIVRELDPRFVVCENVSGLIRRGLDVVVSDLSACGYKVEATRIRAEDIGAPHRRERLFILAYRDSPGLRGESWGGFGESRAGTGVAVDESEALANSHSHGLEGERLGELLDGERKAFGNDLDGFGGKEVGDWPPLPDDLHAWGQVQADSQPSLCRLADGVSARLAGRRDKLKSLGNAVVPCCSEIVGRYIAEKMR